MSFSLKLSVDASANTSLPVTDTTGLYSATPPLNLTGWDSGLPDMPSISGVDTATLTITTKDTAIPYVINVFPTLPNTSDAPYTITPAMIGYTTTIPQQVLVVKYSVSGFYSSGNPFTFSTWCLVGVLVDAQCCVNRLNAAAVTALKCNCSGKHVCKCKCPDEVLTFMKAYTLLYGIRAQICEKQKNDADATLLLLENTCNCN